MHLRCPSKWTEVMLLHYQSIFRSSFDSSVAVAVERYYQIDMLMSQTAKYLVRHIVTGINVRCYFFEEYPSIVPLLTSYYVDTIEHTSKTLVHSAKDTTQ